MSTTRKKKKDFKLREEIVLEFERFAPSRKQTEIVEQLLQQWIEEKKNAESQAAIQRAYERDKKQLSQGRR